MSLSAAITALASVSVTGVTHSYDLDEIPDSLQSAQLPVLIPFLGDSSGTMNAGGFNGGSYEASYNVQHVLIVAPVATGRGIRDVLPTLATLIDAYITALHANPFLGGAISSALSFRISEPGIRRYPDGEGQPEYFSVVFDHQWRENV